MPTVRVGNRTQISSKTAIVSGTLEAVNKAGRDSEMEYQVLLHGLEIRRDIEKQMLSNKASVIGNSTTAAQSAGLESWLTTNVSRGAGGASGGYQVGTGLVNAPTDGTQRAFTEALLKTVHAAVFTAGGKPNLLFMHPTQKVVFSAFPGIAVNRINQPSTTKSQATIIGGADTYVGDFGNLTTVTDLFMRNRVAILVDPDMAAMASLRPMKNWELAKTGDSLKRQILQEYTLEIKNEAAFGIVADLT